MKFYVKIPRRFSEIGKIFLTQFVDLWLSCDVMVVIATDDAEP